MFQGSIVALITPMSAAGAIDLQSWRALLRRHAASGTDGVVVAGTTGESSTLTENEFRQLLESAVDEVGDRMNVLAGTGAPATHATIQRTQLAAQIGAAGALVVTPYYNRPGQDGLYAHYQAVADAVELPLVLYNVPARTAVDMQPETVARLAAHTNIVALKEANASPQRLPRLQALLGGRLRILSGDDPTAGASMLAGAHGVISVVANSAPAATAELCRAARAGNADLVRELDQQLAALYELACLGGNPAGIKWCLWRSQWIQSGIRLPLTWLAGDLEPQAQTLYQAIENLVTA